MSGSSLTAWGILRADDVVAIAAAVGLPLAAAAALLEQESGGGRNVFGSDRVATGGAYVKGAEVTEQAYRAYRAALAAGRAGQQGVGPCQLTSVDFQNQADALGGAWQPVPNMRVGFGLLARYTRDWGLTSAFRAYNGGAGNRTAGRNANADRYAVEASEKYQRWVTRLGPASTTSSSEDDMPLTQDDVNRVATAVTAMLLGTQVDDLYPDKVVRKMSLAETWQWAAAHAGRSVFRAEQILDVLDDPAHADLPVGDLNAALRAALAELGPLTLTPAKELPHG